MANLNKVMLLGRISRDAEVRYTPSGSAVAEIGIAISRRYTAENGEKREEVTFVDVTVWKQAAEFAGQYGKKGREVFVEGRLSLDTWDDKQTGQKRSKLKITGESFELLGGRQDSGGEDPQAKAPQQPRSQPAPPRQPATFRKPEPPKDPDLDPDQEDDIPF